MNADKIQQEDLTVEDIKACEMFGGISEAEAQKVIDAIRIYTEIIYQCYQQGRLVKENSVPAAVVTLSRKEGKKAA